MHPRMGDSFGYVREHYHTSLGYVLDTDSDTRAHANPTNGHRGIKRDNNDPPSTFSTVAGSWYRTLIAVAGPSYDVQNPKQYAVVIRR